MAEEKVFYDNGGSKVTNTRFIANGTTYPINGITSVAVRRNEVSKKNAIVTIVIGAIILFTGFSSSIGVAAFGALVVVAGFFWFKSLKDTYHVVTSSAGGETDALWSHDSSLIREIESALNNAIIERG